jgi:hypothetical protein
MFDHGDGVVASVCGGIKLDKIYVNEKTMTKSRGVIVI